MNEFFKGMDSDGRFWTCVWALSAFVVVVVAVCVTVGHSMSEIYNPRSHTLPAKSEPTVKARLVPVEDK